MPLPRPALSLLGLALGLVLSVSLPQEEAKRKDELFMPRADMSAEASLEARVLDPEGRPRVDVWFRFEVRYGPQLLTGHAKTDAAGRLRIEIVGALHEGVTGTLRIEPGEPYWGLRVIPPATELIERELPEPLPRGRNELGDLRLKRVTPAPESEDGR